MDLPLYRRVRALLGRNGWLDAGVCKPAALATRATIAAAGDCSVVPLPQTGETTIAHLTLLSPVHRRLLHDLRLSAALSTDPALNSS
ncbi:MAG: hypothetical protein ACR2PL_05000 [Dehalococcoidia bacterium]